MTTMTLKELYIIVRETWGKPTLIYPTMRIDSKKTPIIKCVSDKHLMFTFDSKRTLYCYSQTWVVYPKRLRGIKVQDLNHYTDTMSVSIPIFIGCWRK
jgi:hypothetical protein